MCSLIEYISRETKNHRGYIVKCIGQEEIENLLYDAEVNHCLSFEQVCDEVVEEYKTKEGCVYKWEKDRSIRKMNENRKIVLDTLNEQNIEYEMFEHQAVYTVDEIEDSDLWNHENGIGAKNLFLRDGSGKHHFLVIIREDKQADLKKVRDEIGSSRLSFASAQRLMKYLNIGPGSVSPLGILNDKECVVPVFFDEDLKEYEYIAVHPNDNTATIWMKLTDLLDVIKMHGNQVKFINV